MYLCNPCKYRSTLIPLQTTDQNIYASFMSLAVWCSFTFLRGGLRQTATIVQRLHNTGQAIYGHCIWHQLTEHCQLPTNCQWTCNECRRRTVKQTKQLRHRAVCDSTAFLFLQINKDTKRRRNETSQKLQAALRDNTAVGCTKFVVNFPSEDQHNGHVVGEVRIVVQRD